MSCRVSTKKNGVTPALLDTHSDQTENRRMEIEIILDEERELDAMDILGSIRLISGRDAIEQKNTFVDSWLFALVENLETIENGEQVIIDLVDEPDQLEVRSYSQGISIRYRTISHTWTRLPKREMRQSLPAPRGWGWRRRAKR